MNFWLILLIVFACLLLMYLFFACPRIPRRPLKGLAGTDYAHRGLWNDAVPENSLPAFKRAAEAGFGIELDVHLTRDGQLVVFHDDSLLRMCGVDKPICGFTLDELSRMRLKGSDEAIPSFDAVLDVVGGRVPLIVEIKPDKRLTELCEKTCARLRRYPGSYCVESFHPLAVRWFRKHAPEILRGQLAYGVSRERHKPLDYVIASLFGNVLGRPDFIAYEAASDRNPAMGYMRILRPWLVAWTIRSQTEMDGLRGRYDLQIFERFTPSR